jgi:hypothetical protein
MHIMMQKLTDRMWSQEVVPSCKLKICGWKQEERVLPMLDGNDTGQRCHFSDTFSFPFHLAVTIWVILYGGFNHHMPRLGLNDLTAFQNF